MQNTPINQSYINSSVKFGQYVAVPSLEYARNLHIALHAISFSCSPVGSIGRSQSISLQYAEGSVLYTLGGYAFYYILDAMIISFFATANLRGLNPALKSNTHFAEKMHLLRTPVSGLGSKLFEHAVHTAQQHGASCIKISADASSIPFYIKMSKKFSDHFVCVDEHHDTRKDWGCDFVFTLKIV